MSAFVEKDRWSATAPRAAGYSSVVSSAIYGFASGRRVYANCLSGRTKVPIFYASSGMVVVLSQLEVSRISRVW